jgi:hypothetical protein
VVVSLALGSRQRAPWLGGRHLVMAVDWSRRPTFAYDADITVYWPQVRPCWEERPPVGWTYDPPRPCGGISTNGAEPPVCEVHLAPWGHARIAGAVQ